MFVFISIVVTAVTVALLFWLAGWLRSKGTKLTWYEVLIAVLGVGSLLFAYVNWSAFNSEFEFSAASMSLLIFGLLGLLLLIVAGSLMLRKPRAA